MTKAVWKFPFCSLHFQWCFQFLEKVLIWLYKIISIKQISKSKVEKFLKSNFDLNQICKMERAQNHYIWNFNATDLLYIFIEAQRNALKL